MYANYGPQRFPDILISVLCAEKRFDISRKICWSRRPVERRVILVHRQFQWSRTTRPVVIFRPGSECCFHFIIICTGAEVDKPDKEEQTALHICVQNAIVHSSYAAVERLLAAGACVNV